jgi:hypothetical protein
MFLGQDVEIPVREFQITFEAWFFGWISVFEWNIEKEVRKFKPD